VTKALPITDGDRADEPDSLREQPAIAVRAIPDMALQIVALVGLLDIAGAEDRGADNLESGGRLAPFVSGFAARGIDRGDMRLLEPGRNQAVQLSVEFRAFADGEDIGIRSTHVRADGDAASDVQAGIARDLQVRTDTCANDDRVAGDMLAAGK